MLAADSFTSARNYVTKCGFNAYGVFLSALNTKTVTDSDSLYYFNGGQVGGVYYFITSNPSYWPTITMSRNTYIDNVASSGGVMAAMDLFYITMKDCTFSTNLA